MWMVTIIKIVPNCQEDTVLLLSCYCVSSGQYAVYNPVKEETLEIKVYYSDGEGLVVSTMGVVDRICKIGVVFII